MSNANVGQNFSHVADDEMRTFGDMRAEIAKLRADNAAMERRVWRAEIEGREAKMFLRGCLGHFYDETPLLDIAKDVTRAFHRMVLAAQEQREEIRTLRELVKEHVGCCEGQD